MLIFGHGDMYSTPVSFENINTVKEVVFEDDDPEHGQYITSIGSHLFDSASNLETVYLSNEITKIDDYAFYGCKSLKAFRYGGEKDTSETLNFPSKLKYIGVKAFMSCDDVAFGDLKFGNTLEHIDMQAFMGDNGITSIYIPESVKWLGASSFENCTSMTRAEIHATPSEFRGCLYGDTSLEELILPGFVPIRNEYSLNQFFNDNEEGAFNSTEVPESLKKLSVLSGDKIPANAFSGFSYVETIAIPEGITSIGEQAFAFCKFENLICSDETKDLSFSDLIKDVEVIGKQAFINCENLKTGDIVFGDKTQSIDMQAFQGNKGITSIYVPESVTWLGASSFENCTSMTRAEIRAKASDFRGCLYGNTSLEELVLPGFVTIRNEYSLNQFFNDNEEGAFNSTDVPESLKKLSILSGDTIPDYSLSGYSNVETIALPEGIKSIGKHAFAYSRFKNLICSDETKDLSVSELFKDVTDIADEAFQGCENAEFGDLHFENIANIGEYAFKSCQNITSLYIPATAKVIGFGSFMSCGSISKITLDCEDAFIAGGIFYGANNVKELEMASISKISSSRSNQLRYLFNNHSNSWELESIPECLEKISFAHGEEMPENYLNNFYDVKTLSLPNELKLVGKHATQDMKALEEVIYDGTEEEWNEIDIREENDPLLKKIITFAPVEEAEWVTGDANGDGELDMSDVVLIMQALANPDKFGVDGYDPTHITANGFKYADTNGDGLTVGDAANIQRFLLGLSDSVSA